MHFSQLLLLAAGAASQLAQASPIRARSPYVLKESHNVPAKWSRLMPAPKNHMIELRIGVKQGDFDELENQLYQGE